MKKQASEVTSQDHSQRQNLRKQVLPPLVIAICLLQGAFLGTFYQHQQQRIKETEQTTAQRVQGLFYEEITSSVLAMNAALEALIRNSQVMRAFQNRDRQEVVAQTKSLYERLRNQNQITHFYFHQPDRVNFLRLHKDLFGDKINRITLQNAEKTGRPNAGLEQGPTGNPVLRSVYPWRSDFPQRQDSNLFENPKSADLVGYVELGIEFQDIAKKVRDILDVDLVMAMDKRFLKQQEWETRNKKLGYQSNWQDFANYVVVDRTLVNLPSWLNQEIAGLTPQARLTRAFNDQGKTHQVIFLPLTDLDGRNLGHIIVLKDISSIEQASQQSMLLVSLCSLAIGTGLVILFYIFLGRVERNISKQNLQLTQAEVEKLQLQQAKEAANIANQAKSDFLASMSHELRTPLNGILGYAQILGRSSFLPDKERHGVNVIHQCGTHLLTLINDILDLAKIEARKLELISKAVHLPSLLQGVAEICQVRANQKGIAFHCDFDQDLPSGVEVDEKRLRQVLINLLSNAIKFTDKGSVTLKIAQLSANTHSARLHFSVADTGVGIASDDVAKLFQAFEQVGDKTRKAEGTGLGLALSQQIVQFMGGQIQVKSQLSTGSDFWFDIELPLASDWNQQQTILGNRLTGYEGSPRRILIVDDRWENRGVLSNLLEPLGFVLSEAENGQEGLEKMRDLHPDLVITDIAMPVMDGFELLQQVRQSEDLQSLKVIVSSASVAQADQQMAQQAGGDDFLPKPVDANILFTLLAAHLDLKWVYDSAEEDTLTPTDTLETVVLPPVAELNLLLDLAQQDNLKGLRERLESLVKLEVCYQGFAAPLLQLSKQFRAEEIEETLQNYLAQESSHVNK